VATRQQSTIEVFDAACCPVLSSALSEDQAVELARVFAALADPVRLRLLSLVASEAEVCSCELEEPLGKSQPTVSHHTKALAEAGLIVGEKRGKWMWWRVVPERLDALRQVPPVTTGLTIRPLREADWPAVHDIYAAGIATGDATFETEPPTWERFDARRDPRLRFVAVDDRGTVLVGRRERLGCHHGRWRDVLFVERRSTTTGTS
jgi:ArsR family transcriptional regulator